MIKEIKKLVCKVFGHKWKKKWFEVVGRGFKKMVCIRCDIKRDEFDLNGKT